MFRRYYPCFVKISTSRGYYPHFVHIKYIYHITSYLSRNIHPIFHIYSFSESDWCNLHMFYSPCIFRILPHIYGIPNSFIFPLSQLTPCVQIVSFLTHAIISIHTLVRFFMICLTQLPTNTITHIL